MTSTVFPRPTFEWAVAPFPDHHHPDPHPSAKPGTHYRNLVEEEQARISASQALLYRDIRMMHMVANEEDMTQCKLRMWRYFVRLPTNLVSTDTNQPSSQAVAFSSVSSERGDEVSSPEGGNRQGFSGESANNYRDSGNSTSTIPRFQRPATIDLASSNTQGSASGAEALAREDFSDGSSNYYLDTDIEGPSSDVERQSDFDLDIDMAFG